MVACLQMQGCKDTHRSWYCPSGDSYNELADEVSSRKQDFLDGVLPQFLFTYQPRELRKRGLSLPNDPSMFKEQMKCIKKNCTYARLLILCVCTLRVSCML